MTAIAQTLKVLEASGDADHQRDVMSPLVVDWPFRCFLRLTYDPFQPATFSSNPPPIHDPAAIDAALDEAWDTFACNYQELQEGSFMVETLVSEWKGHVAWPVFVRVLNGSIPGLAPETARSMWGDIPALRCPIAATSSPLPESPVVCVEAVPYGLRTLVVVTDTGQVAEYALDGRRLQASVWSSRDVIQWPLSLPGCAGGVLIDGVRCTTGRYHVSDVVPLSTARDGKPSDPYRERSGRHLCRLPQGVDVTPNLSNEVDAALCRDAVDGLLGDPSVEFVRIRHPDALYVLGETKDILEARRP